MKLLMVYNFDSLEGSIENPNFYKSCAEYIFPKFSIKTSYLPNLKKSVLYKLLVLIRFKKGLAWEICSCFWLIRYGHKYDAIIGWLTGGIIAGFLKRILLWRTTKVCLILYQVPDQYSGLVKRIKSNLLKFSSSGCDTVLALDRLQAKSFAQILGRDLDNTKSLKYGVHTDWYDERLIKISQNVLPGTIFCPGSAYRNDSILKKAVEDLEVCIKRYQLDDSSDLSKVSEKFGMACIEKNYNIPYKDYIVECRNAAMVVIAVENSDKPVGLTSLLECMALGRPVIITDGASSRDYVIDGINGFIFEEGNWQELNKKICFLLDNPYEAERIGRNAREQARDKFGLHPCGEQLYQHLRNMEQ